MEPFEYQGYWWLPENPDNKHFGILSFSHHEGLRLEILGSFTLDELKPGGTFSFGDIQQIPVINGVTREGRHFTLFDCDSAGPGVSAPGFSSEQFIASYAFEEYTSTEKRPPPSAFHKALVQYTYLPDWVGTSGIKDDFSLEKDSGKLEKLEISYRIPDVIVADLEQAKISIVEGFNFSNRNQVTQGVSLRTSLSLKVEVIEEIGLEDWLYRFVRPLQEFLTLATRRPNAITRCSLYSSQNQYEASDGTLIIPSTTIYFKQPIARKLREEKVVDIRYMLFGYRDIKDELEQVLQTWLLKREEFESTMDLFFAVENSIGMYLNNEFLNLSQALEVYHRERFNSQVDADVVKEHQEKTKAVVDAAPAQYREWLASQLNLDRQVRLNQRLHELLTHTGTFISKLVVNRDVFARKVTKTRNFLTHYSKKSNAVMEGEELFRATQVLSYMIQICILLELGLSEERIVELFERNQKFLQTALFIRRARLWQ